jgi:hypothetical protein
VCITLRKEHRIPRHQVQRRAVTELDKTLAFGDQMEYHHAVGARLQYRRRHVCRGRLVTPGRRKAGMEEDGTHQAHHAQGLRQGIHDR